MSILSSLNIAKSALSVNQAGITVVSNNVANMDTEGYSKLRVNQSNVVNYTSLQGQNSAIIEANSLSGVQLDSITRYSNFFLETYCNDQNSVTQYYSKYNNIATSLSDITNELNDTGISGALDSFYSAVTALSNNPSDSTMRQNYVAAAENLCNVFNTASSSLTKIKDNLVGTAATVDSSEIAVDIKSVNDLLDQINEVNTGIKKTNSSNGVDGVSSSALLDKRDALVTKLSSLVPIDTSENVNGTIEVNIGGVNVVGKSLIGAKHLEVTNVGAVNISVIDPADPTFNVDVTSKITSGSIGAIIDVCGNSTSKLTVDGIISDLDDMANSFAKVMNDIQTQTNYPSGTNTPMCMTADGTALEVSGATNFMFVNGDTTNSQTGVGVNSANGITASNITVNFELVNDPYKVAAARQEVIDTTAIGNNSNMTLVESARTDSSLYVASGATNSTTLETSLSKMVVGVGTEVASIKTSLSSETTVLQQIKSNLAEETGVDLNEELSDMIKFQRAYQAAARIFSVCNDLLGEMVNLGK